MERKYEEIFERAAPYLRTRKNDIHVKVAYDFTRRLLAYWTVFRSNSSVTEKGLQGARIILCMENSPVNARPLA